MLNISEASDQNRYNRLMSFKGTYGFKVWVEERIASGEPYMFGLEGAASGPLSFYIKSFLRWEDDFTMVLGSYIVNGLNYHLPRWALVFRHELDEITHRNQTPTNKEVQMALIRTEQSIMEVTWRS